jgi:hypothetical protein
VNTSQKSIAYVLCRVCQQIFMIVGGHTPILLAEHRSVRWDREHFPSGTCPKHKDGRGE